MILAVITSVEWCLSVLVDQVPNDASILSPQEVAVWEQREDMERCRQKIAAVCPDVYTVSVIPQCLTPPKGASKRLRNAPERNIGISPEEVPVFGDGENDIDILSKVPHSVAVANVLQRSQAAAFTQAHRR